MSNLPIGMEKEKLVASTKPIRGREMQTTDVQGKSLGNMLYATQKKLQKSGNKNRLEDDNLIETVKTLPRTSNEADKSYHVIYKPGQQFLVPDSTLAEMERIVNARIKPRNSFRFKNEFSSNYPVEVEVLPDKLDAILEKIDVIGTESESSSSVSTASSLKTILSKDISNTVEEKELLEEKVEPVIDSRSKISDEAKKTKLHFRIFGNYTDLPMPKFKVQQFNQDFIGESTNLFEQTKNFTTRILNSNSKFTKNKAQISISAKLFQTPSEGFLNTFYNSIQSEPVDTFTIKDKMYSFTNAPYECPFTISGKFLNEGENQPVLPTLSIRLSKKRALYSKSVSKKVDLDNKLKKKRRSTKERPKQSISRKRLSSNVMLEHNKNKGTDFYFFPVETEKPNFNAIQNQHTK